MTIDELRLLKQEYETLSGDLSNIVPSIKNAVSYLTPAISKINSSFLIDNSPADNNKLTEVKTKINSAAESIPGIISKISTRIGEIDAEIRRLEEEERQRQAALQRPNPPVTP